MLGFGTTPVVVDKIQEIENKSEAAISVFKNTLESLNDLEIEATSEITVKEEAIANIQSEIGKLKDRQNKNRTFINKLNEFFE
jgi:prefoldin subunit 5